MNSEKFATALEVKSEKWKIGYRDGVKSKKPRKGKKTGWHREDVGLFSVIRMNPSQKNRLAYPLYSELYMPKMWFFADF